MPKIPEERPRRVVLERAGVTFSVGDGGDIGWEEIDALNRQIDLWNAHHPDGPQVKRPLTAELVAAIVGVRRAFPGSYIEDLSAGDPEWMAGCPRVGDGCRLASETG
jgi:hypothetical protein